MPPNVEGEIHENIGNEVDVFVRYPAHILFISHDASRTGAPIVLLHLLRWLRANTDLNFRVLLKRDGPLRHDFETVAETTVYAELLERAKRNIFRRAIRKVGLACQANYHFNPLPTVYKNGEIDLVYSNTAMNGDLLPQLSYLRTPVICHVHELEYYLRVATRGGGISQIGQLADVFLAASNAVKENLILQHNVNDEVVHVVHEFVPVKEVLQAAGTGVSLRQYAGIPEDEIIVGGSGCGVWRKGIDLFVQLALLVKNSNAGMPIRFVWVGGDPEGLEFYQVQHDIERVGLVDNVIVIPEVASPARFFRDFDIMAMVSREDPFPLVCLECACLATPIVCFDHSGGVPELVEEDCGFVVPYLDLRMMAERIMELACNPVLRNSLGRRAAEKVSVRHDVSVAAPEIYRLMMRVLGCA